MTDSQRIVFAGGGSGGHLSPGLAIAERIDDIAPTIDIAFLCSRRAIDATMLGEAGRTFVPITASGLSLHPMRMLQFVRDFRAGRKEAGRWFAAHQTDAVLALGGFVAAPVVAAARAQGITTIMLNLDDPPGKANRFMTRWCDAIWSAIELPGQPGFAMRVTGMPIRRRALTVDDAVTCRRALGFDPDRPVLLVTGASQGATSINNLMRYIAANEPELLGGWQILHLTGERDAGAIREAYDQAGLAATVKPFEHQMALAWGAADLAISRAGASSVAEAAANGVPTIFLPYPHHRDKHQKRNAQPLVDAGGAVVVEDRDDTLATLSDLRPALRALLNHPEQRLAMRTAMQRKQPGDAAEAVANLLLESLSTQRGRS